MKAARALIAMLLMIVLAGCIDARSTANPLGAAGLGAPREIPIDAWGEEMLTPVAPEHCDPADPWVCDAEFTGFINVTGTLTGGGPMVARHHWDPAANAVWIQRIISFSGNVDGCGSGAMTLLLVGHIFVVPDPARPVFARANVTMVPGTATPGLSGLVDFDGKMDQAPTPAFSHQPFAHITGKLLCR